MWVSNRTLDHLREVVSEGSDRYELLEEIGRGGLGVVFAANDTLLGRRVALKVLNAPEAESESRILARLEHPGIVPVYDAGVLPDGRTFYAMKLIEGVRLDRYAEQSHSINERLRVFERVCEPVAFAHARGVLHRDLKPSNVMIGSFGEVLVLDWGVPGVIGTEGFMAPEQLRGAAGARSDIFALGCLLHALTGSGAPKAVRAIAAKASAQMPEDRYDSVAGLIADVGRYLDGEPVSAYRENPVEWTLRMLARHRVVAALLAAYLLMRVALIFFTRR